MSTDLSRLSTINQFQASELGVYSDAEASADFNYSDGAESEQALLEILKNARDLSSDSAELQAKISDWPTEYHLSMARANLLRALDLTGVKRVLELGCGCGSITRYLGEQPGVVVDSVEGSPSRAALAKMRCRELEQVEISTANFNEIQLPEAEYDLVLFVGVTEYAGRFSDALSDQEALNDLLEMGRRACKADGVVLVAIENRLGMKYALGASEDHYALPFVGIENYPHSTGIRTYSKAEWIRQITNAGFREQTLLLPFPDYKIPTVVLRENCEPQQAALALASIMSRDYSRSFCVGKSMGFAEAQLWNTLTQAHTLAEHSNSFMWLLGDDVKRIDAMAGRAVSEFDQPAIDYELPEPGDAAMRPRDAKLIEHLNAQITQLESHSRNLEGKVAIMSNSIGWKFLNGIRRLFRKTTL